MLVQLFMHIVVKNPLKHKIICQLCKENCTAHLKNRLGYNLNIKSKFQLFLTTWLRGGNSSTIGGFHCPPFYEAFNCSMFGWTTEYFEGTHYSKFGWKMNFTWFKLEVVFWMKNVPSKERWNPLLEGGKFPLVKKNL